MSVADVALSPIRKEPVDYRTRKGPCRRSCDSYACVEVIFDSVGVKGLWSRSKI
jgi:hypothetical protein